MTDEEFIDYVEAHSKTERALFSGSHIKRFFALAGEPDKWTYLMDNNFYALFHSSVAGPLARARARIKAPAWHIVDIETRPIRRYIDVDYKSLKAAVDARTDLLRHFASDNPWRERLAVRAPDGSLSNPDKGRNGRK